MKLKVYSSDASSVEEREFPNIPVFEGDKGTEALLSYIIMIGANMRQGNACAKMRGEVSGTGKKPRRQKGTGMARAGSIRSPLFSGGGVTHGPRPRDYSKKLNKKVKRLSLARVVFNAASDGSLVLIQEFKVSEPKTKLFNQVISRINDKGTNLIVDDFFKDDVLLAARNIPNLYVIEVNSLNAWDIIRYKNVVMTEAALERLLQRINY